MLTDKERQAYNALQKRAARLNRAEWYKQWIKNKQKKLKTFSPNYYALELTDACGKLLKGEISADEAMSLLHTVEGRMELELCINYEKKLELEGYNLYNLRI